MGNVPVCVGLENVLRILFSGVNFHAVVQGVSKFKTG